MKELNFIQLQKGNEEHCELFKKLMLEYVTELEKADDEKTLENFIKKWTESIINIQGDSDRHLEFAYFKNKVVGFLYGKIDKPEHKGFIKVGFGYIMEFYVKPKYQKQGFGRQMFKRIEILFEKDGASKMYLNTRPQAEPFWKAIGFIPTDEICTDNKMFVWVKDVDKSKEIITMQVSEYLTNELASKIALAQWHSNSSEWVNRVRRATYEDKYCYDCFDVVATNQRDEVIGRLHCIQNENNKNLCYYGDLFVIPTYRRIGIASKMLNCAINYLTDKGAKIVRCYVEPENTASITLQKSLGFIEKTHEKFNLLETDGEIMFELSLPCSYNVIPATADEAVFVTMFYNQNLESLHGKFTSINEWKEILFRNDPDEENFLVCKGSMPVAWFRVNGLLNKDKAFLSMPAVSDKHQHQGVGVFVINFAESYVKEKGFAKIGIHTTDDNIPAKNLYQKCGYAVTEYGDCTTGDGMARKGYTFEKVLFAEITYKQLGQCDLYEDMLINFNRYQEVKKYYFNEKPFTIVKDCDFIENWDENKKQSVIGEDFREVLEYSGTIYGAFHEDKLIGFSCFDGRHIGNESQYLQLIYLHVSCEYRNRGIGRTLFSMCADSARKKRAKKLYISTSSSYSTQQFYRLIGCVPATEHIAHLCDAEPYDIQMEFDL